jgi:GNAT superfamily N-acetyltransferase
VSGPIIREAREEDLPALVVLLGQLDPDNPDREDVSRPVPQTYPKALGGIVEQGHRVLVLEEDDQIAGTLALYMVPNVSHRGTPFAVIENVVVDDGHRAKGYGKLLMERAEELAREAGCYKVVLTSNARRTDAHRFYDGLGYQRSHQAFRKNL